MAFTFPGVEDIANSYRTLAQLYIIDGFPGWGQAKSNSRNAPYKTGNLYNSIGSYNTAAKMATVRESKAASLGKDKVELPSITLSLNYAPPQAQYGRYVHQGTGTNSQIGPRPFAEVAANDSRFKAAVDKAIGGNGGPIEKYLEAVTKKLEKAFAKYGQI